ncbi:MAG: TRAP transporter small permease subunit [Methylobacterium sp.]|nr:TRAP transporter small permease subunit [Methylobacterium sp.]MCA3637555.1 TRAP transporter small permease subunit [Methylobacterium sp.]MCA3643008.1 TRAP transporter small permease subunit [Methylobacterium sp.]
MQNLLKISGIIDALNTRVGQVIKWAILAAVVISTVNAVVRKLFNVSSNAWLEAQWYLFGAVFMLGAAYTFLKNEHIRIDVVTSHFAKRTRDWIDVFGHVFFLIPFCWIMIWHGWPFFLRSFQINEQSMNAGGLTVWPAKILVPLGFALLLLQAFSELIKRVAIIRGDLEDVNAVVGHGAAAEAEAERLLKAAEEAGIVKK